MVGFVVVVITVILLNLFTHIVIVTYNLFTPEYGADAE